MIALVTGASSGIGYSIARYLSKLGYDIVAVARRKECLENLKQECSTYVKIICLDLSVVENVYKLYQMTKDLEIDVVVNDAGFGLYGEFYDIDFKKEISMINLNVIATDLMTKLYLKDMVKRNSGKILNVSSVIGFMPGPLMSSYYATKAYINSMSRAINIELKMKKKNVTVSSLCAGAVDTNFNTDLGVENFIPPSSSEKVAKYAIDNMLKGKEVIIPGFYAKITYIFNKIIPVRISKYFIYLSQNGKRNY